MSHTGKMKNRIRELREARGLSMRALAELVNTTGSNINKLEKGQSRLDLVWIEKFAKVFNVQPAEIIDPGQSSSPGVREDVVAYSPGGTEAPRMHLTDTQFSYTVQTDALDQIGILPGATLVVDMSPSALADLQTGDVVIAQVYDGMQAKTLLRQFIAPSLLITNCATANAPTINLRNTDAAIKGVLVGSYTQFRGITRSTGKR